MPLDECWHGESARASAVLVPVVRCGAELSDTDAVALQLLAERRRGATSMRAAHLAELPATSDATLFWSAAELDELRGSAWHELAAAFGARRTPTGRRSARSPASCSSSRSTASSAPTTCGR